MRKIDRAAVPLPECLTAIPEGWTYDELRGAQREQLRNALLAIQGHRCAYCERRTGENAKDGHIEHFRNQAGHQNLTLVWENMFWSCNDENSCGKFKDGCRRATGPRAQFDPSHLIDPSIENPEDYLLFVTDGTVRAKDGLDQNSAWRAIETLRVFNLSNCVYLRKAREDAVSPYCRVISWFIENAPHDLSEYIRKEEQYVDTQPFSTVIRHFFRGFAH